MDGQTEKYHKANIHFPPCLQSAEKWNQHRINPLTPELNPSAQRCLLFLAGILIFKGLTARRLYKPFGVKGLIQT
jgi:hypothetical protein